MNQKKSAVPQGDEKIRQVLEEIRPHLQMDGGDVEFVNFNSKDGVLEVKMHGACIGCPMSQVTLQDGIGRTIMTKIPEVKSVRAV